MGEERAAPPLNVTNPRREAAAAPERGAAGEETAAAAVAAAAAMRERRDAKAKRRREARGSSVLWRCRRSIFSRDGAGKRRRLLGLGLWKLSEDGAAGGAHEARKGAGTKAGPNPGLRSSPSGPSTSSPTV